MDLFLGNLGNTQNSSQPVTEKANDTEEIEQTENSNGYVLSAELTGELSERIGNTGDFTEAVGTSNGFNASDSNFTMTNSDQVVKKKTGNPIFLACMNYTNDPYWISFFQLAANGKFQRGLTFRNNTLTYRRKNKVDKCEISFDPQQAAYQIMNFLHQVAGMNSNAEREYNKRINEESLLSQAGQEANDFSALRKKAKVALITKYVEDISVKMSITLKERLQLLGVIEQGFLLGMLDLNNVEYSHGSIINITGVLWDPENRKFYIDPNYTGATKITKLSMCKDRVPEELYLDPKFKVDMGIKKINFSALWDKKNTSRKNTSGDMYNYLPMYNNTMTVPPPGYIYSDQSNETEIIIIETM